MSESKFVEYVDLSTALWEIDDDDTVAIGRCAYLDISHHENDTITIDTQGGWYISLSHQRGTLNLSVFNGTSEELSIDLTNSQGRFEMRPR